VCSRGPALLLRARESASVLAPVSFPRATTLVMRERGVVALMDDISEEPVQVVARVCAIDIGKAGLVACVRVPHASRLDRRVPEVREYATVTLALLALADWLRVERVELVAMEATWRLLEAGVLPAGAQGQPSTPTRPTRRRLTPTHPTTSPAPLHYAGRYRMPTRSPIFESAIPRSRWRTFSIGHSSAVRTAPPSRCVRRQLAHPLSRRARRARMFGIDLAGDLPDVDLDDRSMQQSRARKCGDHCGMEWPRDP
jgi:hypothetical protein